jgi:hypothetical protein
VSFLSFTMWAYLAHGLLMVVQALTHVSTQWHRVFMGTPYELILALESISGASRRESMLSWRLMGLTPGVR